MLFTTPSELLNGTPNITVIGAGGTGSYLISYLAQINYLLKMLSGQDNALNVTLYDHDTVSEFNVGRQNFWPMDIGKNKATSLIERINMGFGTNWQAVPAQYTPDKRLPFDILMTCLDRASVRFDIGQAYADKRAEALWIDGGNSAHNGQVVMGHLGLPYHSDKLPNIYDLYGDVLGDVQDEATPSCSHQESIRRQDFGVNHMTAFMMSQLVWRLLRHGGVNYQGGFFDLNDGEINPLKPLPEIWQSFGFEQIRKTA